MSQASRGYRPPVTLFLGLAIILVLEVLLLAVDMPRRQWTVVGSAGPVFLPDPSTPLETAGRFAAANMTPLCWIAYLLAFDGLLAWLARARNDKAIASIRHRPNRFLTAWLTSIPVWCYFDWVNFRFMDAWRYHGMPEHYLDRVLGYFIAFAAISPGMFLAAQFLQRLAFHRLQTYHPHRNRLTLWLLLLGVPLLLVTLTLIMLRVQKPELGPLVLWASGLVMIVPAAIVVLWTACPYCTSFAIGTSLNTWAVVIGDPLGSMVLWVGLFYLADPISHALGGPSILHDWQDGRWGRMLSLFAGGAFCGLCWEFWNYWATTKWTYHLPFLGPLEGYRYFEMPWLGFLGFLPFALECWAVLNVILAVLDRIGLHMAEPLPEDDVF